MARTAQRDRTRRKASGGPANSRDSGRTRPIRRDPGGGAVARGRVAPDRFGGRRGDRTRYRCIRQRAERRLNRSNGRGRAQASGVDRRTCGAAPAAGGLCLPHSCHERWPDLLRPRQPRPVPPRGRLRRSHPPGGETRRPAGAGADQIRTGHQSQDREGAGPRSAADAHRRRRRGDRVRRRAFLTLLGGAAGWPILARAQQTKPPTIGFFGTTSAATWAEWTPAFVQRLRELGWIEGRTVAIEWRWAEGRSERFAEIAAELVARKVDIIVTSGGGVPAAKQATSVIPIVFALAADPLGGGLVASLSRPGGNVTGLSQQAADVAGKRLEILREMHPRLRHLAVLADVGIAQSVF